MRFGSRSRARYLRAFGEAVRHFRTGGRGRNKPYYTEEQLAERVRALAQKAKAPRAMTVDMIRRIEKGQANPNLQQLQWICDALGVSLAQFFMCVESKLR